MKKIQIPMTKKAIFEAFGKLGYRLAPHGAGFYNFVNHEGKESPIQIWFPQEREEPARVSIDVLGSFNGGANFDACCCRFEWLDDSTISLVAKGVRHKGVFINFHNFDRDTSQKL